MSVASVIVETNTCPVCGKNLAVMKERSLIRGEGDRTYCSKTCAEIGFRETRADRSARTWGSRAPFRGKSED